MEESFYFFRAAHFFLFSLSLSFSSLFFQSKRIRRRRIEDFFEKIAQQGLHYNQFIVDTKGIW